MAKRSKTGSASTGTSSAAAVDAKETACSSSGAQASEPVAVSSSWVSPLATPLLDGKGLERSLRLLKKSVVIERGSRGAEKKVKKLSDSVEKKKKKRKKKRKLIKGKTVKSNTNADFNIQWTSVRSSCKSNEKTSYRCLSVPRCWFSLACRIVFRGVSEVGKMIRRGSTGLVFLASDVYPIDVAAHLPGVCEEKQIPYAYLAGKRLIGAACRSKRPASVVMVVKPANDAQVKPSTDGADDKEKDGDQIKDLHELYDKVEKSIKKNHPFL
eukprot:GHVT01099828.1.p1 GENE.GHVT01099828.1~~GHVT01099828.1.p1  ORF type:complete len:269 (-),score=47.12 GHVT01099828.1:716-1522(-)